MSIGPTAGSKLYIGTAESTPSPDDYIEIGEITDFGSFGRQYQEIVAQAVGSRGDRKFKGTFNDGTMTLKVNRDPSDLGQAAAITARDSDSDYNFKIELNDDETGGFTNPTTITLKAKVMSYTLDMGGPNSMVQATIMLGIKSGSISETAAV
jgi:hypothetical protein